MRRVSVLSSVCVAAHALASSAHSSLDIEETRGLIDAMLADAASRTSLASTAPEGPPPLRIWGFTQFRYTYNHRDEVASPGDSRDTGGFSLNRTRLFFDANPFEGMSARVRTTFSRSSGDASLDQAYATLTLPDSFKLRLGQFSIPLFRDENISAEKQLAVNASVVDDYFNQGNTQGVMVSREWDSVRFWAAFSDGIRSANNDFDSSLKADAAFTTRWEWKIAGESWSTFDDYTSFRGSGLAVMLGGAIHYETGGRDTGTRDDLKLLYLTADIGVEGDGWNLFGAVVGVQSDDAASDKYFDAGLILQGGVFVTDHTELFSRFDMIVSDNDRSERTGDFRTLTAGAGYYFFPGSHALKLTGNVIWFLDEQSSTLAPASTNTALLASPGDGQWAVQVQVQVIF